MSDSNLHDIFRDLKDKPGDDTPSNPMFKRKAAEDTPRPPDAAGSGLGQAIQQSGGADKDPARFRPNDSTTNLGGLPGDSELALSEDLGQILLTRGIINAEQLANSIRVTRQTPGKRIDQALIELGVEEVRVQEVVAQISQLPFEQIPIGEEDAYDFKSMQKLTPEFCKDRLVVPLRMEGSRLVVGTANPEDVFLLDDVRRRLGVTSIKHVLVCAKEIRDLIEAITHEDEEEDYDVNELLANVEEDDVEVMSDDKQDDDIEDADSSPVVRYVNHIIQTALKEGASDIHIEPGDRSLRVRLRIDGVLFETMNPPRKMHASLTSRIKIMANLDIAERRLPQDGRIRATVLGRKLDLRVSTTPTACGEKTVMRILDTRSLEVDLNNLGISDETLTIWQNQIKQPHGIILVTGPTGSGKTTTLYSSIRQMDLGRLNVSTVEDPVEYNLDGITQMQIHERIGMTFGVALKSLLRQDPDVLMIGEIRDMDTATTAIQAALTGHLVLSTLHTNDAPSSVTRMINIGIEPFLIGAALNSVLAQRLVRRICKKCGEDMAVDGELAEFLSVQGIDASHVRVPKGCPTCRETGYQGRVGLYELLVLDDYCRDQVARNPNVTEFRRICTERGMRTLRQDGFGKVGKGLTTVEEILRVTEATI